MSIVRLAAICVGEPMVSISAKMRRTIVHAFAGLVSIHSKSGEIFARTSSIMDAGKV
ncbi:MAG: hypothetical protein WCK07_19180 [Betaproteobacteria bacterium]